MPSLASTNLFHNFPDRLFRLFGNPGVERDFFVGAIVGERGADIGLELIFDIAHITVSITRRGE